jgi:starch synthase
MNVLLATSEAVPFIKTGGLADVTGTLVDEFLQCGIESAIILPYYRKIREHAEDFKIRPLGIQVSIPLGERTETAELFSCKTPGGAPAYFVKNDIFYDREEIYGTPEGDFPDNLFRFTFFDRAVCEFFPLLGLNFDILHCNDWQTGLIPVYTRTLYRNVFRETATVMTLHNLGYQGLFWSLDMPLTGLAWELFSSDGLEFHEKINLLKGGILFSDVLTTVSPGYAGEIVTKEYGFGLEGVLQTRKKDLYGIMNGINYAEWDPAHDLNISSRYSANDLSGKEECKKALLKTCGLSDNGAMLIGLVTRLSSQKGLDIVAGAADEIVRSGMNMVILGKGDEHFQKVFLDLEKKHRDQMSVTVRFDNRLAHTVYAGADAFLMPSRYEPCGLGQLIALRYGAVPIARRTGGLADSITEYDPSRETGTGFFFDDYSSDKLLAAVRKAHEFFINKPRWRKIQNNAMERDFSWRNSAKQYISLYDKAIGQRT